MKISQRTLNAIQDKAAEALERLAQGETGSRVAAEMYCEYLPDKAPAVGEMMARRLNELVEQYESGCAAAVENQVDWLEGELEKLLEGRDAAERCATLSQMIQGLAAISGAEAPELPRGTDEAAENELLRIVYDLLEKSALDEAMMDALSDALDAVETPEDISASILLAQEQLHDTRVVLSMAAYLNAKNGVLGELPPSMTMDEIALGVCTAIDARRVARQVASGEISAERGIRILRAIGQVAGYLLAFLLAAFGAVSMINLLSLGQPVLTVLAFAGVYSLVFDETKDLFAGFGGKLGEGAWNLARLGAKHFKAGVARLRQAMAPEGARSTVRREAEAEA